MATMKKPAMRKAAPKKAKGPSPQQQAMMQQAMAAQQQQQQAPPQQAPQGQPMMKKGGKVKKAQDGYTTSEETTKNPNKFKNLGGETGKPVFKGKNVPRAKTTLGDGKTVAKSGMKVKKAQSGTKLGKALPPPAKSGKTMKKCAYGCK